MIEVKKVQRKVDRIAELAAQIAELNAEKKQLTDELKNIGINAELKIISDVKLKRAIHDRWIISENITFNIPSVDTVMRGQFSDITVTVKDLPFKIWWSESEDIIKDWNKIKEKMLSQ